MPPAGNTALFALVHARVLQGRVGIGVLDRVTSEFQSETLVDPGARREGDLHPGGAAGSSRTSDLPHYGPKRGGYFSVD
jgi:hypothetical protein